MKRKERDCSDKMKIVFVNHKKTQCGVYEFGRNIGAALKKSAYSFLYYECDSNEELQAVLSKEKPRLIIYNYHPSTLSWLNADVTRKIKCPQIGMIHEVTQEIADTANNDLFNFHLAHDPTLLLKNPSVFKAGRLIPPYKNEFPISPIPIIGSFGFGTGGKGFDKIIELVQKEYDEAIIRFNIPFAAFGDADGKNARLIAENCRRALVKPNIKLEVSHEFLEQRQLLDFIARNTVNLFLYEQQEIPRGISSVIDLALAVRRPVAVSFNTMFRHILDAKPSVCVENNSLSNIIENGVAPLERYYGEWSEEMLCWDYQRIADAVFSRDKIPQIKSGSRVRKVLGKGKRFVNRKLGRIKNEEPASWISDTSIKKLALASPEKVNYRPSDIPNSWSLNNILDNEARKLYETTIGQMFDFLPDLMGRKIPEANVQQAFVLDTVYKFASRVEKPKILCAGSFEDSASEALKLLGFDIEEVDPMVNYDLETFITKPTVAENSYDIIFSTSVIEHIEQDEKFLMQMAALLKKGGKIVLTCDYCDSYKAGDAKPAVDFRFYTQKDIKERLLPRLSGCRLVDEPRWDCPNPDFYYDGFNYTFGTIVLEKHSDN